MIVESALERSRAVDMTQICEYWQDSYKGDLNDLSRLHWMLHGLHQFGGLDFREQVEVHLLADIIRDRFMEKA